MPSDKLLTPEELIARKGFVTYFDDGVQVVTVKDALAATREAVQQENKACAEVARHWNCPAEDVKLVETIAAAIERRGTK